jgi:hypothetical protein
LLDDEEFGDLGELCHYLEAETADFVRLAPKLYSRSLGAWCTVEMLSVDWMRALAGALSVHFPRFRHEPYFEECFSQHVEERHAAEALEITQVVLQGRPELLDETLRDARILAEALDGVWAHLDRIVRDARATMMRLGSMRVRRQPGTGDPAPAAAQDAALVPRAATYAANNGHRSSRSDPIGS